MVNKKSGVGGRINMGELLEENKISVEEFIARITDEKATENFRKNMDNLHYKEQFPEIWMTIFTKWMELNIIY